MEFIGRDVWGARHDAGSGSRPLPCSQAWLHHSATKTLPVAATVRDESVQMRHVEQIGEDRFGQGFSYNIAVFQSGRLYVGCGVRRVGSHTGGRNTPALGVVLMGNFDAVAPSPQMRAALVDLLRYAKAEGWLLRPAFDGGHRDLKATACPGRYAYAILPMLNREAAAPPAPTPPVKEAAVLPLFIVTDTRLPKWQPQYLTDGLTKRWVQDEGELRSLQAAFAPGRRDLPGEVLDRIPTVGTSPVPPS